MTDEGETRPREARRADRSPFTLLQGPDSPPGTPERRRPPVNLAGPWREDLSAALVLVLIALPLCLGIALASGAPLASGLIAGVIGGIVVGGLSGSQLMVSGPAAGLSAIVLVGTASVGSFQALLVAVMIGGALQLALGALRAGIVGYYFPTSVIRGMIAAIGIILVLKQIPHALGYDAVPEGDEAFLQVNAETTFSSLGSMLEQMQPGAVLISCITLGLILLSERLRSARLRVLPAAMLVVVAGVAINALLGAFAPELALGPSHLVQLPLLTGDSWSALFTRPDWSAVASPAVWKLGVTLALVTSLETLLSLEATDKLDPYKRQSDANRELFAQGAGNLLSGFAGGLPISGVVVRSAANIDSGARTRRSTMLHGGLLAVAVVTAPLVLNRIPLAAIAAVLIYTGIRLVSPTLVMNTWRQGRVQFIPFVVTALAIVFTDLLVGIGIGLGVGLFFILAEQLRQPALRRISPPGAVLTRYALPEQATFLNRANIERTLVAIKRGDRVEIDGRSTIRFDADVLELLHQFRETARLREIDYRLVGIPETYVTPSHRPEATR
ncbi:MAG TPA: SulP family inorganic anion transporter [Gemmatimonas sp.]|nr:SulP family inorganic anion transporter [Gemmatimonas sp.]